MEEEKFHENEKSEDNSVVMIPVVDRTTTTTTSIAMEEDEEEGEDDDEDDDEDDLDRTKNHNSGDDDDSKTRSNSSDDAITALNMASHTPIRMKLNNNNTNNNRKTLRKRKQRPKSLANHRTTTLMMDGSQDNNNNDTEDAASQSNTNSKKMRQQQQISPQPNDRQQQQIQQLQPITQMQTKPQTFAQQIENNLDHTYHENTHVSSQDLATNKNNKAVHHQSQPQSQQQYHAREEQPPTHGISPNHHRTNNNALNHPSLPEQPDGWRVKLYRLNIDGSWDDCGTGRIVCLYRSSTSNGEFQSYDPHDKQQHFRTNLHSSRPGPHQTTDQWLYQETAEATLCVHAELTKTNRQMRVLLRTRILLRDPYQRQGDNIITWCEPFYGQDNTFLQNNNENNNNLINMATAASATASGVDLALSFQDNAGCLDIWRQITQVQSRAAELLRTLPNNDDSVQRMAAAIAAQHHAHLQQHNGNNASLTAGVVVDGADGSSQSEMVAWAGNHHHHHPMHDDANNAPMGDRHGDYILEPTVNLPDPPTLANLEQIADTIAAIHTVQQREIMAIAIAKDECAYLRTLLSLFPSAEERNDYGKLATLAACVKTILLMNEPSILELVVAVAEIFEQVCSCLEYDPDLREKANHRWFLRQRVKFRTVVAMDNSELVSAIHRSFRANFMRDTLLRPTMDESSLSTLSSIQTFSHADVVKGVTMSPNGEEVLLTESYLVRVIRMLGMELHAICVLEWMELENPSAETATTEASHDDLLSGPRDPSIVVGENPLEGSTWKQYLAPQDHSLPSRRLRRRGCLNFLRELFNMVRLSLQQNDKDDFFSVISTLDLDLVDDMSDNVSQTSQVVEVGSVASTVKSEQAFSNQVEIPHPTSPVSLLSLLGNALADPNMDATEKGAVLEIIAGVAMHDPSFIRRHCIEYHNVRKEREKEMAGNGLSGPIGGRPDPNEKRQVIYITRPNDLLASMLFQLDTTTDAGILLQTTEIMRIILDTDIIGDSGSITAGFKDEADGVPLSHANGQYHHNQHTQPSPAAVATNDQKQFFSLFYEHYMEWLVAPFQFTLLHPVRNVPEHVLKNPSESRAFQAILASWRNGARVDDKHLRLVPFNAIRLSFAIELLSFCVRAHLYRMKFFLLKSRVLGNVMALLRPNHRLRELSGDRCLKLAALRFLRSILSVHDEFYHRHIVQHDLFGPVFAALRENPVGDNLVSSSIVEMCDYIHNENIKSLIEYIVTKHLSAEHRESGMARLEDVAGPYVSTLTVLREAYETNRNNMQHIQHMQGGIVAGQTSPGGSRYFPPSGAPTNHQVVRALSGKALEDQRKFQEADEEESYFESNSGAENVALVNKCMDHMSNPNQPAEATHLSLTVPTSVDDAAPQASGESSIELHRTPRMFSLTQEPSSNHLEDVPQSHPQCSSNSNNLEQQDDTGDILEREGSPPTIDSSSSSDEPKTYEARDDTVESKADVH